MKQEAYDKVVNELLDALGLNDFNTIAIKIEPHMITATVLDESDWRHTNEVQYRRVTEVEWRES